MPRVLVLNATPAATEQRFVNAGSYSYEALIQSSLDRHLPAGRGIKYLSIRMADGERLPPGYALEDFDGVWISGAPFNVYETKQPSVRDQIDFTRQIWDVGIPAFGSCWGLQLMTAALGGSVRLNPRGREVGIARRIYLTAAGSTHPMYEGKSMTFDALCVHEDEVASLPDCGTLLASNDKSIVQGAVMRERDKSFWGVQYHPEFDFATIAAIITERAQRHIDDKLARTLKDVSSIVSDFRTLNADASRADLVWRHGVNESTLDPGVRTLEFRNWLHSDVLPRAARRGR